MDLSSNVRELKIRKVLLLDQLECDQENTFLLQELGKLVLEIALKEKEILSHITNDLSD